MPEDIALEMGGFGQKMVLVGMVAVTVRLQAIKRARHHRMINAATHGGGTASLGPGGGMAAFTFQNRGSGISESLIAGGIESFFRVDPGRQKLPPGSGPGPVIAREILEHFWRCTEHPRPQEWWAATRNHPVHIDCPAPTQLPFRAPVCEGAGFHRAAFGKS